MSSACLVCPLLAHRRRVLIAANRAAYRGTSAIAVGRRPTRDRRAASIVPIHALAPFVPFLRFDRERGDRSGLEAAQRDRLPRLPAPPEMAVGAVREPLQGGVDLGDQLALPVAGPELDRPVGLRGGAVGKIRMILILVLKMLQRLLRLLENFVLPRQELVAKILTLALVHEWLFVGRSIVLVLVQLRYGTVLV